MFVISLLMFLACVVEAICFFIVMPIVFFVLAWAAWQEERHIKTVILVIVGIFLFFKISVPLGTGAWNFITSMFN